MNGKLIVVSMGLCAAFFGCNPNNPMEVGSNQVTKTTAASSLPIMHASDVGVGLDGTVWCIGKEIAYSSGDHKIYKLENNVWIEVGGGGVRIDVDANGIPWLVNAAGTVYQRQGSAISESYWYNRGGSAKDIGVGGDGSVWIIGKQKVSGTNDYKIYKLLNGSWKLSNGGGQFIDVLDDGRPAITNAIGAVYIKSANNTWASWGVPIPGGNGTDITAGHQDLRTDPSILNTTYGVCIIGQDRQVYEYRYALQGDGSRKWKWEVCNEPGAVECSAISCKPQNYTNPYSLPMIIGVRYNDMVIVKLNNRL